MQLTTVEFKSKCLELMDQVEENHEEVIVTRDGKPVAKLIPVEDIAGSLFGFMKKENAASKKSHCSMAGKFTGIGAS